MTIDLFTIILLVFVNTGLSVAWGYAFGRRAEIAPMELERLLKLQSAVESTERLIRVISGQNEAE